MGKSCKKNSTSRHSPSRQTLQCRVSIMYAMMKTTAACLRLHGYWEDINSQAWMSVLWDWNRSTQSSNNKPSPLPFLPSAFSSPAASLSSKRGGGRRGGCALSLFLSFFHFLPPCFCNLSSAASPSLSLVTSERQAGGLSPVYPPVCLSDFSGRGFSVTLLYFSFSRIKIGVDGCGLDTCTTPLIYCKEKMLFFSLAQFWISV